MGRLMFVVAIALPCALAACSDPPPGLHLEIKTGVPGIDKVELFVGQEACTPSALYGSCGVNAEDIANRLLPTSDGGFWYRGDGNDEVFTGAANGGKATFSLEATSDQTVQIVAVGFKAGTPVASLVMRDVPISATAPLLVETKLVPSSPVDGASHSDGDFVYVWQNSHCADSGRTDCAPPSDCVVAEHWSNSQATRSIVVPQNDADCDGYPSTKGDPPVRTDFECSPTTWDRKDPNVSFAESSCAVQPTAATDGSCVVGGHPCIDGMGPQQGVCAPLSFRTYCLPSSICGCTQPIEHCLTSASLRLECTVFVADTAGTPCPGLTSPTIGTVTGLDTRFTTKCNSVKLADPTLSPVSLTSKIVLPSPSTAEFDITNLDSAANCTFDLEWKTGMIMTNTSNADPIYMLDFDVGQRDILLPLHFTVGACSSPGIGTEGISCQLYGMTGPDPTERDPVLNCAM